MALRIFVALELSRPLKAGILDLIEEMRRRGLKASWSRDATLHLTLKFLGDVEEDVVQDVIEAVGAAAREVPPFSFASRSLGAFPSPRRARVVWVGAEPIQELWDIAAAVERELKPLGFPRERRRFSPHITIGRIRDPRGGGDIEDVLDGLAAPEEIVEVREVRVMRSTLAPGGAIHELIAAVPLGEAAPEETPSGETSPGEAPAGEAPPGDGP